ncbi:hypothetical protein PDIG_18480 [Penicillium digitatum PHI26]|uniref:Uncharacterized protein n=2 Tax=Penicillium digitatum TaxID=36651 RepID=K9G7K6_PEND2|nr:hypothetical protein PDIP_56310 [Penicillium digitatum Pd1]EKV11445.1 hypothetical protein PDIP_56310 [Penicillium digitatum Pd1]EKV16932.1 hypothetical protein PDIG_18480 [Penicillium digitatum PHI26]
MAWYGLSLDDAAEGLLSLLSPDPTTPESDKAPYKYSYKTARPSEEKQVKCNFIPGKQPKPGFS